LQPYLFAANRFDMTSDPQHPQAGRKGHRVLLCSAGLNLLLLAAVLALARNDVAKPLPPPARKEVGPEGAAAQEGASIESNAVVTNQIPFRWAQLESEDFRIYIANLRAAHCPERIIYDLVFHDLERLYKTKEAARPSSDLFWKPNRVREAARQETEKRSRQMELEKRALMRDLLGVWWSKEAWDFWYDQGWADIAETLVGFLSNEQVLEALTVYFDLKEASGNLSRECELCSEADEGARQETAYQRTVDSFAEIMSPAEFEEMALRICLVERDLGEDISRAEFRFHNGTEARDFVKLVSRFKPFFSKEFLSDQSEDETRQLQLQSELKKFFGEDRFATFDRSQKAGYQEIWQFGQEQHLPPETILKAWQVREAAEQEFSRVSESADLSPAERAAAWAGVRQQTQTALAALLGATSGAEYLKKHCDWLKASPPDPGGKP
jgi:hypothetical protein